MPSGIGTATLDFGATPANEATVSITGQTAISATSRAEAFIMSKSTATNGVDDHNFAAVSMRFICSEPTPSVGFSITAYNLIGFCTGEFNIEWTWSD
jgi:hypothetical protein